GDVGRARHACQHLLLPRDRAGDVHAAVGGAGTATRGDRRCAGEGDTSAPGGGCSVGGVSRLALRRAAADRPRAGCNLRVASLKRTRKVARSEVTPGIVQVIAFTSMNDRRSGHATYAPNADAAVAHTRRAL